MCVFRAWVLRFVACVAVSAYSDVPEGITCLAPPLCAIATQPDVQCIRTRDPPVTPLLCIVHLLTRLFFFTRPPIAGLLLVGRVCARALVGGV